MQCTQGRVALKVKHIIPAICEPLMTVPQNAVQNYCHQAYTIQDRHLTQQMNKPTVVLFQTLKGSFLQQPEGILGGACWVHSVLM